jgi:hypothetical protein
VISSTFMNRIVFNRLDYLYGFHHRRRVDPIFRRAADVDDERLEIAKSGGGFFGQNRGHGSRRAATAITCASDPLNPLLRIQVQFGAKPHATRSILSLAMAHSFQRSIRIAFFDRGAV